MERNFPDTDDDVVMSPDAVARLLGVSLVTLWRWRKLADRNGLPVVRLCPGRIGYRTADVRRFLASRLDTAEPEPEAA